MEASSPGSRPDSSAEGLIGDPGPAFDAEAAANEPAPEPPPIELEGPIDLEEWEEEVIGSLLGLKGRALHAAIGVAEEDWRYTEIDLAAIVPPLTRICNRYPAIRRYAPYADPITLAMAFGAYGVRSLEERRTELRLRAAEEESEQPIAPAASPPPAPAAPSVPAPKPSAFPAGAAQPPPMAPQPSPPAKGRRRGGEAEFDPGSLEWDLER